MVTINLPSAGDGSLNEYGYVLLIAIWIAFQCYMTGFVLVGGKRKKTYTAEYMTKNYNAEHLKAFPGDKAVPKSGYPDTGSGWYSSKLTYKQWFEFNVAQRIHMNFLEQLFLVLFIILAAGISYPAYTVYAGIAYSVGRLAMAIGYLRSVKGRIPGGVLVNASTSALFVMSSLSMWKLAH